jgi:preprotein translocase subunit SecF
MLTLIKPGTKFDFVALKGYAMSITGIFNLISLVVIFTVGFNFGIDFKGGTTITVRFTQDVEIGEVRSALAGKGFADAEIKYYGSKRDVLIATEASTTSLEGLQSQVETALTATYGAKTFSIEQVEMVGPKVGADLRKRGYWAILLATISMLIYIAVRFEFKFGVGAIVAMVHDVIFTLGIVAIAGIKFNLPILAAILTIIGYSVNDTIVVFDRIREDLKKVTKKSLEEIVNLSVNETLSRTILTGMATLFALTALYFLAGEVLRDFALVMIVGILIGTYSSIYIATPVVIFWKNRSAGQKA